MTKGEFYKGFADLRDSFRDFIVNPETKDETMARVIGVWYKHFADYDVRDFNKAVFNYAEEQKKAPTIADLRDAVIHERYERLMKERKEAQESEEREEEEKRRLGIVFTKELDAKLKKLGCFDEEYQGFTYPEIRDHYFAGDFTDEEKKILEKEYIFD